jgi:hypothetical protein
MKPQEHQQVLSMRQQLTSQHQQQPVQPAQQQSSVLEVQCVKIETKATIAEGKNMSTTAISGTLELRTLLDKQAMPPQSSSVSSLNTSTLTSSSPISSIMSSTSSLSPIPVSYESDLKMVAVEKQVVQNGISQQIREAVSNAQSEKAVSTGRAVSAKENSSAPSVLQKKPVQTESKNNEKSVQDKGASVLPALPLHEQGTSDNWKSKNVAEMKTVPVAVPNNDNWVDVTNNKSISDISNNNTVMSKSKPAAIPKDNEAENRKNNKIAKNATAPVQEHAIEILVTGRKEQDILPIRGKEGM